MFDWVINTPLVCNFVLLRQARDYKGEGERSLLSFFSKLKNWPGFVKECPGDVLRLYRKRISDFYMPLFRAMQIKCFSKCPYFKKYSLPWRIHGYACLLEVVLSRRFVICRIELLGKRCWKYENSQLKSFYESVLTW